MTAHAPTIVTAPTTADLLALLPDLAGVPVRNSIVVAPFVGKQSTRAMRVDLPSESTPTVWQSLASTFLGQLARLNHCDGVAVAIYSDHPYDITRRDWHDGLEYILDRLHDAGYHIKDAALQACDGWSAHFDEGGPRPLTEVLSSRSRFPDDARDQTPLTLPDTEPVLAEQVRAQFADLVDDEASLPEPIALLEKCLALPPEEVDALRLAQLLALIQTEGAVDRTVLQIAFGRKAGMRSWARTLEIRARAAREGCTPMDVLQREFLQGRPDTDRFSRMLTGESGQPVSPTRLRSGAVLLGRVVAHAPVPQRSWAMCALGWVRWALGLASAADEILRAARTLDPRNSLAPYYHTLVTHFFPGWIYRDALPVTPNRAERRKASRR